MWGCIGILFVLVCVLIPGIKYEHEYLTELKKSESKFKVLYPSIMFWLNLVGYTGTERFKRRIETQQMLQPGRDVRKGYYEQICKKFAILYSILLVTSVLGVIVQGVNHSSVIHGYRIKRPGEGFGSRDETICVRLEEQGKKTEDNLTIQVDARSYTKQELEQFKIEAKEFVLKNLTGENSSLEEVSHPLNLVRKIPGNPYKLTWHLEGQDLVDDNGNLSNKVIHEKSFITLRLEVAYKDDEEYMEIPVGILPYQYTWQEEAREEFLKMVRQIDEENKENDSYVLPDRAGDIKASYVLKREGGAKKLILCAVLVCIAVWVYWEESIKREKKNRDQECQMDYPNIVYKLTLLLGAGMTLKAAWARTIQDYLKEKEGGKKRYAYEEMLVTWNEIESGIPELEAFSRFGKRIQLRSYLRFSSLVAQNLKKGNRSFLIQLEAEAREAREEKKQIAKRLGEEAGIKLLFPMLIMLLIVLAIVMLPAFMSFAKGGF